MTPQEAFDVSTRGIIKQGGPSVESHHRCKYRSDNGRKCAIGWLIPDKYYDSNWDRFGIILQSLLQTCKLSDTISEEFAIDLQKDHDLASDSDENFFKNWKWRLKEVAEKFKLDPTVLSEIP